MKVAKAPDGEPGPEGPQGDQGEIGPPGADGAAGGAVNYVEVGIAAVSYVVEAEAEVSIAWDTQIEDVSGYFDPEVDDSLVVPVGRGGVFSIDAYVPFSQEGGGAFDGTVEVSLIVVKGGVAQTIAHALLTPTLAWGGNLNALARLAAGDAAYIFVYNGSSGGAELSGSTKPRFKMARIGD